MARARPRSTSSSLLLGWVSVGCTCSREQAKYDVSRTEEYDSECNDNKEELSRLIERNIPFLFSRTHSVTASACFHVVYCSPFAFASVRFVLPLPLKKPLTGARRSCFACCRSCALPRLPLVCSSCAFMVSTSVVVSEQRWGTKFIENDAQQQVRGRPLGGLESRGKTGRTFTTYLQSSQVNRWSGTLHSMFPR